MAHQSTFSRKALTAAAAVSLLGTVVATAAASPAGARPLHPAGTHHAVAVRPAAHPKALLASASSKLGALAHAGGRRTVFVQLLGSGAAQVSSATLRNTSGSASHREAVARSAALSRRAAVGRTAAGVLSAAKAKDAKAVALFTVSNAVPGIALTASSTALKALAARPDVVKISAIVPKHVNNAGAAQLTNVLATWQNTHTFGDGVSVGIIDTGLDYTHADFGGTGTAASYTAAKKVDSEPSAINNWYANLPALAQAKVIGGRDFVGDDYDATPTDETYQPIPHADPNPLDCNSHGTHVAGTVAGYGVTGGGTPTTFQGDYSTLTGPDLFAMKVGPGMAPKARIYSFKVFGCTGSTDVVIPALDATLDPNGDGNFSDHLNIASLSLGTDYSTPDDPENAVVNAIAAQGVLPVIAMGNNGDLTDTGGSPGNSVRALAVASSIDAYQLRDGLRIDSPTGLVPNNIAAGQNSAAYSYTDHPTPVTGPVAAIPGDDGVPGHANNDGCDPLTPTQAAAVHGKVAWLEWDDNDASRRCGSVTRAGNVKAAGAIGAIFTSSVDVFGSGITGDADIPVFQLPKAGTDALRTAAVTNSDLVVTFDGSLANTIQDVTPAISDTLSGFSSRGTHGSIGVVKPDVTAPGDTIASASMGTGTGVLVDSGTSMATPHTAGIAALVIQTHPDWTVEEVKAAVMNTADHDLYTGASQSGDVYGPARVGAGRVDALNAVTTNLLAFDSDTDEIGGVSASFGPVEAPADQATVTKTRTITVENKGAASRVLSLAYDSVINQPGASYSVSPSTMPLAGHSSAIATVTMTISPALLRHTIDPTMETDQLGVPRQFVSDSSGRVIITPDVGPALRVPVYGAAKPVSAMHATAGFSGDSADIALSGTGVSNGGQPGDDPLAYNSLVSVLTLGATSAQLPACTADVTDACTKNQTAQGGDIHYVGTGTARAGGSLANGYMFIGVSTWGNSATIGNAVVPYVLIDTNGDNEPDYEIDVTNFPASDVLVATTLDLNNFDATGAPDVVDTEPVNTQFGDVDTNVFDTNVLLIPVTPGAIGVTDSDTSFPIRYTVGEASPYGTAAFGGDVDDVGDFFAPTPTYVSYDVAKPAIVTDNPIFGDTNGAVIPVGLNARSARALVLHLHNASGTRDQVVTLLAHVPGAPTGVLAHALDASATVSWTAPTSTGGTAITGYDVQYSADHGSTWHSASSAFHSRTATTETVTGLLNATFYVFRVAAINAAGTGPYSVNSAAVKPVTDTSAFAIGGTVSIHKGQSTTVRGTLTDTTAHKPIAGATVLMYSRINKTGTTYKVIATVSTDSAGHVSRSVKPSVNTRYLWQYAGSTTHARAQSVSQLVNVG